MTEYEINLHREHSTSFVIILQQLNDLFTVFLTERKIILKQVGEQIIQLGESLVKVEDKFSLIGGY